MPPFSCVNCRSPRARQHRRSTLHPESARNREFGGADRPSEVRPTGGRAPATSQPAGASLASDTHPRIAAAASSLFRDGHYRNATLDASLALADYVKEKSGRHDLDGATLMRTVFSRSNPTLVFNRLANQSDLDEQEGMMHLFEGVMLALRNPRAHRLDADAAEYARESIAFMSMLAKRLDRARALGGSHGAQTDVAAPPTAR